MRFYAYVLYHPNGEPFYFGKGSGSRILRHEEDARRGNNCHRCNVIRKIWREGCDVRKEIVFQTENEEAAFAEERRLIALYGRENLCNLTDGGEGPAGLMFGKNTRNARSISAKRRWTDPVYRSAQLAALQRPEARTKANATLQGKPKTAEHRAKIAAASTHHKHSDETKKKLSRIAKAREEAKRKAREIG